LNPPHYSDFLRLLQAWRVWTGGAAHGVVLATVIFIVLPPSYRGRASVFVDQIADPVILNNLDAAGDFDWHG